MEKANLSPKQSEESELQKKELAVQRESRDLRIIDYLELHGGRRFNVGDVVIPVEGKYNGLETILLDHHEKKFLVAPALVQNTKAIPNGVDGVADENGIISAADQTSAEWIDWEKIFHIKDYEEAIQNTMNEEFDENFKKPS